MSANRTQTTTTTSTTGPSMSRPIPPAPANPANHEDNEEEILWRVQEWVRRVRARKAAEAAKRKAKEEAARAAEVRKKVAQKWALRAQQQEEEARGTSPSEVSVSPRRPVVEIPKGKGKAKAQPVGEDPNDSSNGDNDNDDKEEQAPCEQCKSKKIPCQMQAGKRSSVICKPSHDAKVQCMYSGRPLIVKKEGSSHPIGERLAVLESQMAQVPADNRQLRRVSQMEEIASQNASDWSIRIAEEAEKGGRQRGGGGRGEKGREEEEEVDEEPAQLEREE
ncbi:hypothetical protein F5879DRAFT_992482 [Lentinula edodes]|nr:hypothetical protein F5879DRAFT_992482 [Lentinula edodes]